MIGSSHLANLIPFTTCVEEDILFSDTEDSTGLGSSEILEVEFVRAYFFFELDLVFQDGLLQVVLDKPELGGDLSSLVLHRLVS